MNTASLVPLAFNKLGEVRKRLQNQIVKGGAWHWHSIIDDPAVPLRATRPVKADRFLLLFLRRPHRGGWRDDGIVTAGTPHLELLVRASSRAASMR